MSGSSSSNPDAVNIAAPEALQMTVHTPPRLDAARRTAAGRWTLLLLLAACAAPVIASYFMFYVVRPEGRSNYAALIEPARPIPADLALTDLDGRSVSPASLRGQWLIVVVGDAACDAACGKRLFAQRQLREMSGRERERIDKLFLVTDAKPLRAELRAALAAAPSTQVLRAPRAALAAWLQPAEGQALDAHLYLVDPMGLWMMRAPPTLEPSKFKRDIERVLRASSSWDTPGR